MLSKHWLGRGLSAWVERVVLVSWGQRRLSPRRGQGQGLWLDRLWNLRGKKVDEMAYKWGKVALLANSNVLYTLSLSLINTSTPSTYPPTHTHSNTLTSHPHIYIPHQLLSPRIQPKPVKIAKLKTKTYLITDDLHALAREEPDLEPSLAPPPDGLLRRRHVDHADHVAHLFGKRKGALVSLFLLVVSVSVSEHSRGSFKLACVFVYPLERKYSHVIIWRHIRRTDRYTPFRWAYSGGKILHVCI